METLSQKEKQKEYYQKNKEKIKEYYQKNKEKLKEYWIKNKEILTGKKKEYNIKNKEAIREKQKEYREKNKEILTGKKQFNVVKQEVQKQIKVKTYSSNVIKLTLMQECEILTLIRKGNSVNCPNCNDILKYELKRDSSIKIYCSCSFII